MNYFSHHIRSLLFEDRIDSSGEFSCHRHDSFPRCPIAWMALIDRAVKLSKLAILADGRPRGLDQFTAKPAIAAARDVTARNSFPGGMFGGRQPDKPRQLAHVAHLLRITDSGQKMAGDDLTNPRDTFQMGHRLAKLRVLLVEAADLFDRLKGLLLRGFQTLQQPIQFKTHHLTA